jgi:hypothetical protein
MIFYNADNQKEFREDIYRTVDPDMLPTIYGGNNKIKTNPIKPKKESNSKGGKKSKGKGKKK